MAFDLKDPEWRGGEHCKMCGSFLELRVNKETGRYLLTMPTGCATKEDCEARVFRNLGLTHESDQRVGFNIFGARKAEDGMIKT